MVRVLSLVPTAVASGGGPTARFPLLFRPRNPTRNAEAPARPQIPVITKALPPDSGGKPHVIMKNSFFVRGLVRRGAGSRRGGRIRR